MAETRAVDEGLVRGLVERALAAIETSGGPRVAASATVTPPAATSAPSAPAGSGRGAGPGLPPPPPGPPPAATSAPSAPAAPIPVPSPAGSATSVAIGADHGGVALKAVLTKHLSDRGFGVTDCGTTGTD